MSHSPFPWRRHTLVPTAVFDADGKRIIWDAPAVTSEPVAWQCIDDRHEFRYIKGIVTVNQTTVEAWTDGGLAFVGLAPIISKTAPLDPETAADNAALIAAVGEMVEIVKMFVERIERHSNWDDGCFYYGGTSASELQEPLEKSRAALASIGRKP